jgi:hypothetical protein
MSIKGFKVFNPDWTCRGFQYKVGETFVHNGNIEMCGAGFHFCQKASDCFNYYNFNSRNKVAEVEALGLVETYKDKSVTDKIKIIREIEWPELLTIVNDGKNCTGLKNTGNWNTGDWNTGDYNSTNYSTGFFNSVEQNIFLFNKPTSMSRDEIHSLKGIQILNWNFENSWWIYSVNMSDDEKKANPKYETTGGYLKTVDFKTACKMMWENLSENERQEVMKLPNFDSNIFYEITGIIISK